MSQRLNRLRLNSENRCALGVCAGIADWLDVPAALVRIVFIICVLSWPTLIIGYFVLYFCLDKDITPDRMKHYFNNAKTAEHFRRLNYRKPIYKNERDKRIAGVCSGLAEYLEVSSFSVRLVTILSLFVFGPYSVLAYVIAMFVFDPDPDAPITSRSERRSRRRAKREARHAARMSRKRRNGYRNDDETHMEFEMEFEGAEKDNAESQSNGKYYSRAEYTDIYNSLELRLREIEAFMTSKRFRLHCEINRI